ncbi:SMC-Scp complex subunit ScpB [Methylomagnum sp.]
MQLKAIIEAALLAAGRPVALTELQSLFVEAERPEPQAFQRALIELAEDCRHRPVELKQVASGYRLQVREAFSPWVSKLFEERPARYSRAFLETLAIVAYRQPVTRGEIEDIRGVAVSSNIVKTLLERGWVQSVGHKEVPGRPALLATTRQFLDYFNLTSLADLPPLREFIDRLDLALPEPEPDDDSQASPHADTQAPIQPAQPTE